MRQSLGPLRESDPRALQLDSNCYRHGGSIRRRTCCVTLRIHSNAVVDPHAVPWSARAITLQVHDVKILVAFSSRRNIWCDVNESKGESFCPTMTAATRRML
jgi:hypothetical protein